MSINAYPLQWPLGWKRTQLGHRREARFSSKRHDRAARALTVADGVERVLAELDAMGYGRNDTVISTNVELRLDGLPRSDRSEPGDPGAAVYWRTKGGENKVMAIDQYDRVADNLGAIAATLNAMRAIERHGGAVILERAFTGFTALPAPTAERNWWDVLQVPRQSTREAVKTAYRGLASKHHPDKPGGSHSKMAELNAAQESALLEVIA